MGRPTILLVVQTRAVADAVIPWLHAGDYDVVVVDSFARAKLHLDLQPALVITELRLGEYNGLHLALRAQSNAVPAIVIGEPDTVLENDAHKLGAIYLRKAELVRDHMMALLASALRSHSRQHVPGSDLAWVDGTNWQQPSTARTTNALPGKHSPLYH